MAPSNPQLHKHQLHVHVTPQLLCAVNGALSPVKWSMLACSSWAIEFLALCLNNSKCKNSAAFLENGVIEVAGYQQLGTVYMLSSTRGYKSTLQHLLGWLKYSRLLTLCCRHTNRPSEEERAKLIHFVYLTYFCHPFFPNRREKWLCLKSQKWRGCMCEWNKALTW